MLNPLLFFEDGRLQTFKGKETVLSSQDLARAGFIWTLNGTMCVFCKGIIEWELNDDPFEEHARLFYHCQFVKFKKRQDLNIYRLEKAFFSPDFLGHTDIHWRSVPYNQIRFSIS